MPHRKPSPLTPTRANPHTPTRTSTTQPDHPGHPSTPPIPSRVKPVDALDPIESVNTFIGTKDEGNTFPGASMPFGKAHSSPIGSHYAGYRYDDQQIRGFGHFFLSGAGCWEQGVLVPILPVI